MSTRTEQHCLYIRTPGTLARDTGLHVLAMAPGDDAEVTVLGGGSAAIWRILRQPQDLTRLREQLAHGGDEPPDRDVVAACLDDLIARRLVSWLIEEDEL